MEGKSNINSRDIFYITVAIGVVVIILVLIAWFKKEREKSLVTIGTGDSAWSPTQLTDRIRYLTGNCNSFGISHVGAAFGIASTCTDGLNTWLSDVDSLSLQQMKLVWNDWERRYKSIDNETIMQAIDADYWGNINDALYESFKLKINNALQTN